MRNIEIALIFNFVFAVMFINNFMLDTNWRFIVLVPWLVTFILCFRKENSK
jgi:hypothetical protein